MRPDEYMQRQEALYTQYIGSIDSDICRKKFKPLEEVLDTLSRVRPGTVVAAGGAFQIHHYGHNLYLEQSRSLGDHLVVCMNSDESLAKLGRRNPAIETFHRIINIASLECVDNLVLFDESTPEVILGYIKPDIWTKGAGYTVNELPETKVVEEAGGKVIIVETNHDYSGKRFVSDLKTHDKQFR